MKWLKRKIRKWLGIVDPDAFLAVDYGYRDRTALCVIQRRGGSNAAVVEIINFPAGVEFVEIQRAIQELQERYGIRDRHLFEDGYNAHHAAKVRSWL